MSNVFEELKSVFAPAAARPDYAGLLEAMKEAVAAPLVETGAKPGDRHKWADGNTYEKQKDGSWKPVAGSSGSVPGSAKTWSDGNAYDKQRDGTWARRQDGPAEPGAGDSPDAPGPGPRIRFDTSHAAGYEDPRKALKQHIERLAGIGKSMPEQLHGKSVGEHIRIAKEDIAKHDASFERSVKKLKAIAVGDVEISGRTKTLPGAIEKLCRKAEDAKKQGKVSKYRDASDMTDSTGMRIVGKSIASVKENIASLQKNYSPPACPKCAVIETEDYITTPKAGYRSFHYLVKDEDGLVKEIQVRTERQNVWANWSHDTYKPLNQTQRNALREHAQEIDGYQAAMSEHYFQLDMGKNPGRPPQCPDLVRTVFGCMQ